MGLSPVKFVIGTMAIALACLSAVAPSRAQVNRGGQEAGPVTSGTDSMQTELHMLTDVQRQGIDRKEENAYKAFYNQKDELDKKIQLGQAFLQKYPKSPLAEAVDAGLVNAYVAKQDWKSVYASADSALALKPDDVDVLTTVGWVIPHVYQPSDPDASAELDKAETYAKHALEVMATMPKPPHLSDAQFAVAKAQKSAQAHSALGLVYYRRDDFANSAKEMEQAMQGDPHPDATDLYVFGMDLQNLKRYGEAADAFNRCALATSALEDACKQNADVAKRQSAQSK
ncbi:MAG TPA: tetratricopeptide repeat protein [Candidatus Acidoferrales bacterium]